MSNNNGKYNLEERTAIFGEEIIKFCRRIKKDIITAPLINQLVRSGTTIGANYSEADDAESRQDFKNKLGICKKEARETKHWLRMIAISLPETKNDARIL
jgi:four helix bundle protein